MPVTSENSPLLKAMAARSLPKQEAGRTLEISAGEAMGYDGEVGSPISLDVNGYIKEKKDDGTLVIDVTFCQMDQDDDDSDIVTTQESHVP